MKFSITIITLIICQYFVSQVYVNARPQAMQKNSWPLLISDVNGDDVIHQLDKRKPTKIGMFNSWIVFSLKYIFSFRLG
jgi:hypothetical protein